MTGVRKQGARRKLNEADAAKAVRLYSAGDLTVDEIADLFNVSRMTIYRAVWRNSKGAAA